MPEALRVREVASSRGPRWLATGFRLFRRSPLGWLGLAAGWLAITLGLLVVPIVGPVVSNVLQPVFFASFAFAAYKQLAGEKIEMGDLFAGFRVPIRPLVNIGLILLVAELGIFWVMGLMGLPPVTAATGDTVRMSEYLQALSGKGWILAVGVALTALVKGALWFAPALLAFHELSTAHAIRWSVFAALSNLGALLTYGIVLVLVFAVGMLPWGLGLLVVIPAMLASTYAGYSDIFDDPAGPEAPAAVS